MLTKILSDNYEETFIANHRIKLINSSSYPVSDNYEETTWPITALIQFHQMSFKFLKSVEPFLKKTLTYCYVWFTYYFIQFWCQIIEKILKNRKNNIGKLNLLVET